MAKLPEGEFIEAFESLGASALARKVGCSVRNVYQRRADIEKRTGRILVAPTTSQQALDHLTAQHPQRATVAVENGTVLVGSDLHAWPGEKPTAFRAFLKFSKKFAPEVIVMNGDVIDGASISRHPPIGWEKQPTLIEEMEVAQEWLHALELAAPKKANLYWPLGNHDARFSTRLATVAPEYAKIHGIRLQDHFGERWQPCWSVWINGDVVVKHRHKGGIHAAHNSTLWAGKTMITGHLHSLKVSPLTDYQSTRFGVDTGMLADPEGKQFQYVEDNPVNWRSGFVLLTFRDGHLMWPEIIHVLEPGAVEFRGEVISV